MPRLLFKAVRISAGLALIALFLHTASLAVRDCTAGLYTYDNCLWLWVGEKLGLLQSRLARAVVLEVVGLGDDAQRPLAAPNPGLDGRFAALPVPGRRSPCRC